MIRRWMVALTLASTCGCMQARVQWDERWDPGRPPAYVDYIDSYWGGFQGQEEISLARVCMDQKPYGLKKVKTFEDVFLSIITLFIYTPTTVKVWCGP